MVLTIDLPDHVAQSLERRWGDLRRHVLEALAIEGYRDGTLSRYQVQCMLGLESRFEVDAFMKSHDVPIPYDIEDLEHDAKTLRNLRPAGSR
jgi:hypothetical protein